MMTQIILTFYRWYYRLVGTETLTEALQQVVDPWLLREGLQSDVSGGQLLEFVLEHGELDRQSLLEQTAALLNLPASQQLELPAAALIEKTGYSPEQLEAVGAIPQYLKNGGSSYVFVVSDPAVIAVGDYATRGVATVLAYPSEIKSTWQKYREIRASGGILSEGRLATILQQLARDASACGAGEVFVGHPDPDCYEFLVDGELFSGKIHRQVYQTLLQQFANSPDNSTQLRFELNSSTFPAIFCSLTKNFSSPVIYLSWEPLEQQPDEIVRDNFSSELSEESPSLESEVEIEQVVSVAKVVLLVDDDPRFAAVLSSVLNRRGYCVVHKTSGAQALSYLDTEPRPEIIVSDVHMPQMDGVELLQKIRELNLGVPVLMLTSDEDQLLQVELVKCGADAFVRKQDDVRVLLAWCGNLTSRGAVLGENSVELPEPPPATANTESSEAATSEH